MVWPQAVIACFDGWRLQKVCVAWAGGCCCTASSVVTGCCVLRGLDAVVRHQGAIAACWGYCILEECGIASCWPGGPRMCWALVADATIDIRGNHIINVLLHVASVHACAAG